MALGHVLITHCDICPDRERTHPDHRTPEHLQRSFCSSRLFVIPYSGNFYLINFVFKFSVIIFYLLSPENCFFFNIFYFESQKNFCFKFFSILEHKKMCVPEHMEHMGCVPLEHTLSCVPNLEHKASCVSKMVDFSNTPRTLPILDLDCGIFDE